MAAEPASFPTFGAPAVEFPSFGADAEREAAYERAAAAAAEAAENVAQLRTAPHILMALEEAEAAGRPQKHECAFEAAARAAAQQAEEEEERRSAEGQARLAAY